MTTRPSRASDPVPFREAVRVWARVAALSFGGPAGQIAVMHRILVEEKRWIGDRRFLHALNYCMLLPGPEAQQLAIYIGWLLNRTRGGLVAGTLFVLPGFVAILALSFLYVLLGDLPAIEGLFFGLKAAVIAIVFQALYRIGSRSLGNGARWGIAAAAFLAIFAFGVPFPAIVVGAALIGFVAARAGAGGFGGGEPHSAGGSHVADSDTVLGSELPAHARPDWRWSARIAAVFLLLWLVPVAALLAALGPDDVFSRIGLFFSQMAVVTFGGAYAVLAYVAQQAVETYGWLSAQEMLDGLGMAETTPGPLIMVTQFVGFLAAYRNSGALDPLAAATFGAVLTTWVTFTPCFLWIFLGAPFVERLRGNKALTGALSAITAAVVGVIANLAVWFSLYALFAEVREVRAGPLVVDVPLLETANVAALALTAAAFLMLFRFRLGVLPVIAFGAAAGMALRLGGIA
ncbi:MAG: chromate efflux transporter [Alphaproteobacteria bacterium]